MSQNFSNKYNAVVILYKRGKIETKLKSNELYDYQKSKEKFPAGCGKAARNELRKIRATFSNNTAIGVSLAGYFIPIITLLPKLADILESPRPFIDDLPSLLIRTTLVTIAMAISVTLGRSLIRRAVRILSTIED